MFTRPMRRAAALALAGVVNVILGDIKASNGTIHAIDCVLIPPAPPAPAPAPKDIVDTAIAAGSFKTLVTAVQAAGLEGALRSAGRSPSLLRPMTRSQKSRPTH